jgi:sugar phosphate isomerase/epimerase
MIKPNNNKIKLSRRHFLKTASTAAAAVFSIAPLNWGCSSNKQTNVSNFGGVQLGSISYSWSRMPAYGPKEVLQYCIDSGIGSLEARWIEVEAFAGIPEGPEKRPLPQDYKGTEQERKKYEAAQKAAQKAAREEQRQWRISAPMTKFEEFRQMYNDAGVNIHLAKMRPLHWSDEETDYAFRVAKALGAKGVGEEISEEACRRLAPFAEKHDMYVYFHNHGQVGAPGFSFDNFLKISPKIMLNVDVGHFYGATGINPTEILKKYHDRILSVHLKDKTGPNADPRDTNMPFGEGDTPLVEVLQLIKKEGWPIVCDVELEYPIPEGSDAITEVKKCVEYCRQALI